MNRRIIPQKKGLFRYRHFAGILLGIFTILFRMLIQNKPERIEYGYSRTIYPYIADTLAAAGRAAPIFRSVSELALVIILSGAALWFFHCFYQWIRGRQSLGKTVAEVAINTAAAGGFIFFLFTVVWGLNYYREPFYKTLTTEPADTLEQMDYEQIASDMATVIQQALNAGINDIESMAAMDQQVNRALKNVVSLTAPAHMPAPPRIKTLYPPNLMDMVGIAGCFLPVFMESHINMSLLPWERVRVIAHEKAHFFGFASERDANLIAYISCLSSDTAALRYAAALSLISRLYGYIPDQQWKEIVWKELPEKARQDREKAVQRYRKNQKRHGKLTQMQRKLNDTYLKSNNQKQGIGSYGAALPYLTAWWKNNREKVLNTRPHDTGSRGFIGVKQNRI